MSGTTHMHQKGFPINRFKDKETATLITEGVPECWNTGMATNRGQGHSRGAQQRLCSHRVLSRDSQFAHRHQCARTLSILCDPYSFIGSKEPLLVAPQFMQAVAATAQQCSRHQLATFIWKNVI